jgi:hypothetical protein
MTAHSAKQNAEQLLHLSDEVSRIAGTLARLSTGRASPLLGTGSSGEAEPPEVSAETMRSVIHARRLRSQYFPEDLFADPAWDIMLNLLAAEISQYRVSISNACIASAVPATTALRWLKLLERRGLIMRRSDAHDGRRVFVELTPEASVALRRYFADAGSAGSV